ncbi:MAG: hypothetical protein N2319_08285 [Candidatus Kapabacteria bacterium]|nr:hypothetical protein [Candidatus Kapabacteria bacterium]
MKLSLSLKILPIIIIAFLASLWLRTNTITTDLTMLEKGFLGLSKTTNSLFDFPYSNLALSNGFTYVSVKFIDSNFNSVINRVITIFLGIISVLIFYLISKKITDDYLSSLFSTAIFSIQASAVFFGKIINPVILSFVFFLCFLYFLFSINKEKKSFLLYSIMTALFLFLSVITNYFIAFVLPFLIMLLIIDVRKYLLTIVLTFVLVLTYYFGFFQNINNQIMGYFSGRDMFSIGFMSHFLRILQEISIPLILLIMVQLNRVFLFSQSSKNILMTLWLTAIPLIILSILFSKIDLLSSNVVYLVAVLLIPSGVLLKDFYIKSFNSRIAVIILFLFSIVLSVYQLGQKIAEMKIF